MKIIITDNNPYLLQPGTDQPQRDEDGAPIPNPNLGHVTEIDIADPPAQPIHVDHLDFIGLCQSAGGMTDAMLVAAHNDANLAPLWIKFDHAPDNIHKDHPLVAPGLASLAALGYLPNGAQAVINAWPTA